MRVSESRLCSGDDDALAADFVARRPDGLSRAYERYAALLAGVAGHVLGDRAAAEDCVHDALLRVWQTPGSYLPERGSLRAFLVACVRNEATSWLRGGGRRVERERRASALQEAAFEPVEPADPVDAARVRAALARLPGEQRLVIESAYFDNLTQAQIAARLGLPLGTVKGRVALALRKLKVELAVEPR
jgi:RNA polymerase sigma-70 factor (ECF subfamily)